VTTLSIETEIHRRGRWITAPLTIGQRYIVHMVLDTGTPSTGISEQVRDDLLRLGLATAVGGRACLLRDLQIQNQAILISMCCSAGALLKWEPRAR
jgi:hypothetical protein